MMVEIIIPQEDANSDSGTVVSIKTSNLSFANKGDVLFEVETSKTVFEVFAEISGFVVYNFELKNNITFNNVVGFIVEKEADTEKYLKKFKSENNGISSNSKKIKLTEKASKIIKDHSIDISLINKKGIITEKDLAPFISNRKKESFLNIEKYPTNIKKVLVIGGSYAAHQVIDIFKDHNDVKIVGIVDDDKRKHSKVIFGHKVIGATNKIAALYKKKYFTHAIISISTNVEVRRSLYKKCMSWNIPMINAIDKSCIIRSNITIGNGNVICGNTYIGSFTMIGDNNFISASTSIDHHNIWHSHISIGPNCVTSGLVEIKDRCRFGMGVSIEPYILIGENTTIASGSIISSSVPTNTLVKIKNNTKKINK